MRILLISTQNDHIFLSHYHDPGDELVNLEEGSEWIEDDRASLSSVVHRSVIQEVGVRGSPGLVSQDVSDFGFADFW